MALKRSGASGTVAGGDVPNCCSLPATPHVLTTDRLTLYFAAGHYTKTATTSRPWRRSGTTCTRSICWL